jgi:hypothetical protein
MGGALGQSAIMSILLGLLEGNMKRLMDYNFRFCSKSTHTNTPISAEIPKPSSQGGADGRQTWRAVEVRALIAVKRGEEKNILVKLL